MNKTYIIFGAITSIIFVGINFVNISNYIANVSGNYSQATNNKGLYNHATGEVTDGEYINSIASFSGVLQKKDLEKEIHFSSYHNMGNAFFRASEKNPIEQISLLKQSIDSYQKGLEITVDEYTQKNLKYVQEQLRIAELKKKLEEQKKEDEKKKQEEEKQKKEELKKQQEEQKKQEEKKRKEEEEEEEEEKKKQEQQQKDGEETGDKESGQEGEKGGEAAKDQGSDQGDSQKNEQGESQSGEKKEDENAENIEAPGEEKSEEQGEQSEDTQGKEGEETNESGEEGKKGEEGSEQGLSDDTKQALEQEAKKLEQMQGEIGKHYNKKHQTTKDPFDDFKEFFGGDAFFDNSSLNPNEKKDW